MKRNAVIAAVALVVVAVLLAIFAGSRSPFRRRARQNLPGTAPVKAPAAAPLSELPAEQWTSRLIQLQNDGAWELLDDQLAEIARKRADDYRRFQLGYLHARVKIERGDLDEAAKALEPFIAPENTFRELALHHRAEVAAEDGEEEDAARFREALIFETKSPYREEAIESHLAWLESEGSAEQIVKFAGRLTPAADTRLRRDLESHVVAALMKEGNPTAAIARGLKLLNASNADDAADRVARVLDTDGVQKRLTSDQIMLLGLTQQQHRHYARAVALLTVARKALPAKADELTFAIGRSYFGDEQFAEAEQTYAAGAKSAKEARTRATMLFHASRAAQLQGDDARAEQFMTGAIAVKGKFPATSAALTQRLRTRLKQGRWKEAESDLALTRRLFANDTALFDASIAFATASIAAGRRENALVTLNSIPGKGTDDYQRAEIAYWRARALESLNPENAANAYLEVLRADAPTHFAYLARQRLRAQPMSAPAEALQKKLKARADAAVRKKDFPAARRAQTDAVLLSADDAAELQRLKEIYGELQEYREVVALEPAVAPRFPISGENPSRDELLLAMGLFDDAAAYVERAYGLRGMQQALTRSLLLNFGGASRSSIYSIEVMMRSVPDDFVPELLPLVVRELLYPRYFYDAIAEQAKKHDADPRLVLSIMREESRFNPRAKSAAAARGLLQFIITTARDVGRSVGLVEVSPEDLYDPAVIIQLGAKYVGDLLEEFGGDRYAAAAAYNAGPEQTKFWKRMAPAPGADYFISAINFEETKHYVRKVHNSYARYGEIYEGAPTPGGTRAEP